MITHKQLFVASRVAYSICNGEINLVQDVIGDMEKIGITTKDICIYESRLNAFLSFRISGYLVVAFRGTLPPNVTADHVLMREEIDDWAMDGDAELIETKSGNVHRGFWLDFCDLLDNLVIPDATKRIYLTGHSKGGALAVIAARYFEKYYHYDVKCVTFGSPKCSSDSANKNYINYEYGYDIVPHMFIIPRGYKRSGNLIYIDKNLDMHEDSFKLRAKRKWQLLKFIFKGQFFTRAADHSIDAGAGYSRFFGE